VPDAALLAALHERFNVIVGGRGDYYDASAASP
jgi:hypothetical protein